MTLSRVINYDRRIFRRLATDLVLDAVDKEDPGLLNVEMIKTGK